MKTRKAYALLLAVTAVAAFADCSGESTGSSEMPLGPTDVVVTWTFAGEAASDATCMARMGTQVYVNLSGTVDPKLHQTVTEDCAKGTVKFPQLDTGSL